MYKVEILKQGQVKLIIITNERLTDGQVNRILFTLNLVNVWVNRYYTLENNPYKWIIDEGCDKNDSRDQWNKN